MADETNKQKNYSRLTQTSRDKLKVVMDDFATFMWRGRDSFDFGAFIINSGDLKFYNGASFANEYSTAQFQTSGNNLLGVSYKMQTLSFKVGVYWFSIQEYQEFLEWLDPYQVDYLTFPFNDKYSYLVKLANIGGDSVRTIVGHDVDGPRYYTELTLTWDLQGPNCVRATHPYEWNYGTLTELQNAQETYLAWTIKTLDDYEATKLNTPFVWEGSLFVRPFGATAQEPNTFNAVTLSLYARYGEAVKTQGTYIVNNQHYTDLNLLDNATIPLFSIKFDYLSMLNYVFTDVDQINHAWRTATTYEYGDLVYFVGWMRCIQTHKSTGDVPNMQYFEEVKNWDNIYKLDLVYDSETGLLYQKLNDGTRRILNLLTTNTSGQNLVTTFDTHKFMIPGVLKNPNFQMYNMCLFAKVECDNADAMIEKPLITCYGRTNVI